MKYHVILSIDAVEKGEGVEIWRARNPVAKLLTRPEAIQYATLLKKRLGRGPGPTLRKAFQLWVKVRFATKARSTALTAEATAWNLLEWLKRVHPNISYAAEGDQGLHSKHVNAWRDARAAQVAGTTLAMECSHIQHFIDFMCQRGMRETGIRVVPQGVKINAQPKKRTFLTTSQLHGILLSEFERPEANRIFYIMAGTGMRIGSMIRLAPEWWANRVISIPEYGSGSTKRHCRQIPVGPKVAHVIESLLAIWEQTLCYGPMTTLRAWIYQWLRGKCIPHDFRRWYSQRLMKIDCPNVKFRTLMGHSLGQRDDAYLHPEIEDLMPWAERIDALLPEPVLLPELSPCGEHDGG